MTKKKQIWDHVIKYLESCFSHTEIKTWFSGTSLNHLDSSTATIEVPNKFIASWLRETYSEKIRSAFGDFLESSAKIQFIFPIISQKNQPPSKNSTQGTTNVSNARLIEQLTFDNFVTGETNRFAFQSALQAAKEPAGQYSPLYIYGETSAGKTHLLHAIGNYIQTYRSQEQVQYITADRFTSLVSSAFKKRTVDTFRKSLEHVSVFLFDDVHLLSGRIRTQTELTSFFNTFQDTDRQIAFAGKYPPNQIPHLTDQIKSRLHWGVISEINAPDQNTKLNIIQKRCETEDMNIPDDAAFFLANSTNDLKELVRRITRLQTYSSIHGKPVDISLVRLVINEKQILSPSPTIGRIQEITAQYFNISFSDLLSRSKKRAYSYPRQLAMYLCRQYTDLSFKEIGKGFHNKDHSTVIYAVRHINGSREENDQIRNDILALEKLIG